MALRIAIVSDIHGKLDYRSGNPRPVLTGAVESKLLQFADLGPLVGAIMMLTGKWRGGERGAASRGRFRRGVRRRHRATVVVCVLVERAADPTQVGAATRLK